MNCITFHDLPHSFILCWYTWVYSVFAWTAFINLRRELLNVSVIVNIITVAPGEHQGVWNQWQFNCLRNSEFRLTTKKYQRFVLLFMYGEQNNTRLCKVAMVVISDTVLCGTNRFDHGRHIWCNGTRQYQPKENYNMRHVKHLVSPSHDGVMTSKRFPCCWPFVGRIRCSPVYFPHKGPWIRRFEVSTLIVWIFMRTVSCPGRMKTLSNGGFPLTKASDTDRGCSLWSAPEQTAKQIIETPVISDVIALIMTSL